MTKEEAKNKIEELYIPVKRSDYKHESDYEIACKARQELRFAAEYGYSLAETELAEKERQLIETTNTGITWMKECESHLKEIERLKGLIEKAHGLAICDLPDEEQKELWQQFKTENNL